MKPNRSTIAMWLVLLAVAFFVMYPLFMLAFGSFKGGPPGTPSPFSLQGYVRAYSSVDTYVTLWTTFWLSSVRLLISLILALFLAWVIARTDTPFRKGLEVMIWLQIFLPLLPRVVAWALLAAPDNGLLNKAIIAISPWHKSIFDIYSHGGIIWVSIFPWSTILFMLITPAFRGVDASLEESSRMSGASNQMTFFRITMPLLAPAILGAAMLGFVGLMESFEPELFLGYGKGIYVYTTRVWWLLGITPGDFPQAMALSTVFLAIVFGLIFLQWRLLGGRQYVTITGRGFATRPIHLGKWKYFTLSIVLLYFIIGTVIPLLTLAMGSLMKLWGIFVPEPFTTNHWVRTLSDPRFIPSLRNTLLLGIGTATIGMIFYSIVSYIVTKTKFIGRNALDLISWLPWGVPGLVLALGLLWAFVGGIPLFSVLRGTLWLLMLAFLIRSTPLGVRVMNGAMVQLGNELEESSRMLGASWTRTFRKIIAPLLSPAFVSAWIIVFLLSVRDLVTVVFLYTPQSRVLSTMMYEHWFAGEYERANVIGLIMAAILMTLALVARLIGAKREIPA